MELAVKGEELRHARPFFDAGLELSEARELGLVEAGHALGKCQRFQSLPHLIEQVNLTDFEQRHASALVRLELGESLCFQHAQRFSHR